MEDAYSSVMENLLKLFPCLGPRHHRVSPEGGSGGIPGSIITTRAINHLDSNSSNARLRDELNGEINLHFVSDGDDDSHVVIECPTVCEYPVDPLAPEVDTFESHRKRRNSVIDDKSSYNNNNSYLTTLFIETAKRKQLRVVHYRAIEDDDDEEDAEEEEEDGEDEPDASINNQHHRPSRVHFQEEISQDNSSRKKKKGKRHISLPSSSGSEDEDEYWFSKWSQRLRVKKQDTDTTKKILENNHPGQDIASWNGIVEGNNKEILDSSGDSAVSFSLPLPDVTIHENELSGGESVGLNNLRNNGSIHSSSPTPAEENSSNNNNDNNGITNLGFQLDEDEVDAGIDNTENSGKEDEATATFNYTHEISRSEFEQINKNNSQEQGSVTGLLSSENIINSIFIDDGSRNEHKEDSRHVVVEAKEEAYPSKSMKPFLFFIHSISGSIDVWKSQIEYFHKLGYEIAAMDLLGHGLSGTPPQSKLYHFESLVQDVVTVFDHFITNEQRQVVVIGHGYGACLATVLTRIRPKNICILISISGGGPTPMVSSYWCESPWIPFPCTWFPRRKKRGRFENPDLKHILPRNIHENIVSGQIWLDGDPAFHRRITVPSLLIYGLKDAVVNLVEVCEMERTIPRAYLELLPTAGHMIMWDEPDKLNRMLRKFIQAQWS